MQESVPAYSPVADAPPDRLILRDGSVAALRQATASDADLLRALFAELSPDSRRQRVLASGGAVPDFEELVLKALDPSTALTLVATRTRDGRSHLVGVGSYRRVDGRAAEVAFAVDDRFHGRGIATALLEHLAVAASIHAFRVLLGDMRFRVAPLADRDIADLVGETRAARLIAGHRGRPPADIAALIQILARLWRLAEDVPEIAELDLNPVIVLPAGEGCDVVDVRMRVG